MAEKKDVATDTMPADAVDNADVANNADAVTNDTTADTNAADDTQAPATTDNADTNADVVTETPKNDTTDMVVYAVDSTAVRIGEEYFYSSDWTITIPATLADQAEAMGLRKVEA